MTKNWFRVRFDSAGKVVTCERTDVAPSTDGSGIYYVRASSVAGAQAEAYQLYLASQRAAVTARRKANLARGLCRCGRKSRPGVKTCATCTERQAVDVSRHRARIAGKDHAPAPPKSAAFAATRRARENAICRALLVDVQWQFRALPREEFDEWLASKILDLCEGPVLAIVEAE